jgi:group I intron endonuclease
MAVNSVDGRIYIGKTNQLPERRWHQHCAAAIRNPWTKISLWRAIRKHGPSAFSIKLLAMAHDEPTLDEYERMYIKEYRTDEPDRGYNMTLGGEGAGWGNQLRKGLVLSEEHKAAISRANTGIKRPWVSARKAWVGRKHSEEAKRKMSLAHKGLFHGQLAKPKIELTDEEKALRKKEKYIKIGAKNRGQKRSAEFSQFLSARKVTERMRMTGREVGLSNRGKRRK